MKSAASRRVQVDIISSDAPASGGEQRGCAHGDADAGTSVSRSRDKSGAGHGRRGDPGCAEAKTLPEVCPETPSPGASAARDRYDTAKFTDHEIEDELGNIPPRHRCDAYLAALRAERDRRSAQDQELEREFATLYAVPLSCGLPNEMPLESWPCSTEDSDKWYAVVRVGGHTFHSDETDEDVFVEEAYIEDVRRVEWELPSGVVDLRRWAES